VYLSVLSEDQTCGDEAWKMSAQRPAKGSGSGEFIPSQGGVGGELGRVEEGAIREGRAGWRVAWGGFSGSCVPAPAALPGRGSVRALGRKEHLTKLKVVWSAGCAFSSKGSKVLLDAGLFLRNDDMNTTADG
jgi:hypothetical protein